MELGQGWKPYCLSHIEDGAMLCQPAPMVNQNWYSDAIMPAQALTKSCQDIAIQFISNLDIDVILAGGSKYKILKGTPDLEYPGDARQHRVRLVRQNLGQECQAPGCWVCVEPKGAHSGVTGPLCSTLCAHF